MKPNILIVEDEQDFLDELKDSLDEADCEATLEPIEFEKALKCIGEKAPDVLILDVYEGKPSVGDPKGRPIYEIVWEKNFIPLIFASASEEKDLMEKAESHPIMEYVLKNDENCFQAIIEAVKKFAPLGAGIRNIKEELCEQANLCAQNALVKMAPHVIKLEDSPEESLKVLKSSAGRRLAAQMRFKTDRERDLIFAWEQYIYPPMADHILTGDIYRACYRDKENPRSYRIILTPSCDLAQRKTDSVLAACFVEPEEFWKKTQLSPKRNNALGKKGLEKIEKKLSRSQEGGYKLIPAYSSLIPHMAVCFRSLEILKISADNTIVSLDGTKYERIVSMDSPFREQLTWAYLEIAGRIGVPDRNMQNWVECVMDLIDPPSEEK